MVSTLLSIILPLGFLLGIAMVVILIGRVRRRSEDVWLAGSASDSQHSRAKKTTAAGTAATTSDGCGGGGGCGGCGGCGG
jgi:hypothetical protein